MIFDPEEADAAGLVIDGFPRTALQADFLKLLYDKMMSLHNKYANTEDEWRFPRPSFKARTSLTCSAGARGRRGLSQQPMSCRTPDMQGNGGWQQLPATWSSSRASSQRTAYIAVLVQVVVLYVEQEESVRRQMMRAQLASLHNQCVPSVLMPQPFHCRAWGLQLLQQAACHVGGCTCPADHMACTLALTWSQTFTAMNEGRSAPVCADRKACLPRIFETACCFQEK